MKIEIKTLQELSQIMDMKVNTLRLYLSRGNFTKYIRAKKINNRWHNAYLLNDNFKRELCDFLERKGYYKSAKLLINYKESEEEVTKFLYEENKKLKTDLNIISKENKKLQDSIDMISKQYNSLLKHHNEWLVEAKKGLDAYEYCIQELEQENEKLKKTLVDCGFWKQDGSYEEDMQEVDLETL